MPAIWAACGVQPSTSRLNSHAPTNGAMKLTTPELDPALVRVDLHPGTQEPGHGPWSLPPAGPADKTGVVAAFNSGFRLGEAQGGYYSDERTVGTLRPGAASLVIKRDGTATVGQWGRDVRLGPQVFAVRQNLALLVDGGQVVPGIADNTGNRWGATLGNKLYVARSGLGVTATGQLVYVAGPSPVSYTHL